MDFILTPHALAAMAEWGVSPHDIAQVLAHGRRRRSTRYRDTTIVSARIHGRRILVALVKGSRPPRVKTVMLPDESW